MTRGGYLLPAHSKVAASRVRWPRGEESWAILGRHKNHCGRWKNFHSYKFWPQWGQTPRFIRDPSQGPPGSFLELALPVWWPHLLSDQPRPGPLLQVRICPPAQAPRSYGRGMKGRIVGGEGKTAEVDGGYFGGYVKPANQKEHCRDRRFARNQNGKRKVVVVIRERGANSVPAVFNTESQAASFIRARIARGTVVHADEAASLDNLHERFEVKRINHQEAYSLDGACTNMAEEYFSGLRRAEIGIHHHIAGTYLLRYAQESSWREDNRRVSNGDQVT